MPPLRNEAYTGEALERQLEEQTRLFLTENPDKNRVDPESGRVYLSPIFDWYRKSPSSKGKGTTPARDAIKLVVRPLVGGLHHDYRLAA